MYRSGLLKAVDGDDIKKNLATMAVRLQCNSFNLVTWWLMVWYGYKCGGFSMDLIVVIFVVVYCCFLNMIDELWLQ